MRTSLLFLALATGCYPTKVLRAESLVSSSPSPALMVSAIVETDASNADSAGLLQTVADLSNNAELDAFGTTVEPAVTAWIATQGLIQQTDKDRLMGDKRTDWAEISNDFTVLTGTWVDPRGLRLRVATDSLFPRATFRTMAERLDGPEAREAYTYTTLTVYPRRRWLVVGVPRMRVSVLAHDHEGQLLLRASAWGLGNKAPFIVDRSPESLTKAFEEAMGKISAAEVQPLESS